MRAKVVRAGVVLLLSVMTAGFLGCGVSDEQLNDAEKRMNDLKQKGAPDSTLTLVKVHLAEARDAKQRNQMSRAHKAADSMTIALKAAEAYYSGNVANLKPAIDSLLHSADKAGAQLTGMQKHKLDSLKAVVDSLFKRNKPVEAGRLARALVVYVDTLRADEDKAVALRAVLPGAWVYAKHITDDAHKDVNAMEKKVFTFGKDGAATYVESETGQSDTALKKDYEFQSFGTYDLIGDTIFLFINRFIAKRQIMTVLHIQNGKRSWEKQAGPCYDSAITDGSQNRYILYADLKEDFKKQ